MMESWEESSNARNWCEGKVMNKIKSDVVELGQLTKRLVQDDPRRVIHSIKVGVAIALVSLFYYFDPLYQGFGVNAMWAVLTVVVVFEYSVGATLGKGVNRVIATIIGGLSAVVCHRLSSMPGENLEPFLLGSSVFLTAAVATFLRFYPRIKARYDYGMVIFILTFSLICVSGYRDDEVIDMAHRRITTILIGSSSAVIVCVLFWPAWAGTDLHNFTATNIDKLGTFLQEFGVEYFKDSPNATVKENEASLCGFKNVTDSKSNVDTLVNFARWEPRHGRFRHRHPWSEYQKVGELTRHCACIAKALHGLLHSQTQAPTEVKAKFQEPCSKMSIETGKALKELSSAITKMTHPSKAKTHILKAKQAAQSLNTMLKSNIWRDMNLSDVTPVATVASLLADVVTCSEDIVEAVQQLASLAHFKKAGDDEHTTHSENSKVANQTFIKRRSFRNHVIIVDKSAPSTPRFSVSHEDPPSLALSQQSAE